MKYRMIKKKALESYPRFEERLNEETATGWRVNSMIHDNYQVVVLLEREPKF